MSRRAGHAGPLETRRLDDRRRRARNRPYLAGPEPTLAQITLGTMVYRWHGFPIERPPLKNLKAWYERMRDRPGFRTHIEIPIT
jgi:glutathione S-transferase